MEDHTFKKIGKGTIYAGVVGVAIAALVGVTAGIRSWGYQDGKKADAHTHRDKVNDLKIEISNNELKLESLPQKVEQELTQQGRVLPKESCFRYRLGDQEQSEKKQSHDEFFYTVQVKNQPKCDEGIEVRIRRDKGSRGIMGIDTTIDNYRSELNVNGLGYSRFSKKTDAKWVPAEVPK
jgi:hypothetical protein